MRKLLILVALLVCASSARANEAWRGWCELGNQSMVTSGINSTTKAQQSFPQCTVAVFNHGGSLATIYADNSNTPLANPFQAQLNGQWIFYAANGRYDVQTSGTGFIATTYLDVLLCDPFAAGSTCNNGSGTTLPHNLLSATHLDTVPASPPSRGDLITGQNATSPTGITPAWARLSLGTNGQVLTSNGTDALWGNLVAGTNINIVSSAGNTTINATAGGTGCTIPSVDLAVIWQHPAGTCNASNHFTWDNANSNLQLSDTNLNTSGTTDTYIIGPQNNLGTVTDSFALGEQNDLHLQNSGQSFMVAIGFVNQIASSFSTNATVAIGGGNTIGDGVHANSGGFYDFVLGATNTLYFAHDVTVLNYTNNVGTASGGGISHFGVVSGYSNAVNCCIGGANSITDFGVYGDSNFIGVQSGNVSDGFIGGVSNHCEGDDGANAGCYIWGLDNADHGGQFSDTVIVGSSNTAHTRLSTLTLGAADNFIGGFLNTVSNSGNYIVVGGANTMNSCTVSMQVGFSMTSCTNNGLSLGVSATPEFTITDKYITFRPIAFASLGTPSNGTLVYCNDCTIANPCNSGGSGAFAKRLNGVWVCN